MNNEGYGSVHFAASRSLYINYSRGVVLDCIREDAAEAAGSQDYHKLEYGGVLMRIDNAALKVRRRRFLQAAGAVTASTGFSSFAPARPAVAPGGQDRRDHHLRHGDGSRLGFRGVGA